MKADKYSGKSDKATLSKGAPQGDALEDLFRHVSARERPPASDEAAVRDALHEQWRQMTGRRRRRRFVVSLAAAASLVLAVIVASGLLRGPQSPGPSFQVAMVEKVMGTVRIRPADGGTALVVKTHDAMKTGQSVVTGMGSRLAIRWQDGASARIDENSEIRLTSSGEIELVSGRLYVDTELARKGSGSFVVLTPAGPVRHLGTQYMTDVRAGTTRVSVREGRVAIGQGENTVAARGEQLMVDGSGNRSLKAIATWGDQWEWTQSLAPAFLSNGHSMADFLGWVGRESGHEVEFASPEAERLARDTRLHGDVDLEPLRALGLMLQTTDLVSAVDGGSIVVALRPGLE